VNTVTKLGITLLLCSTLAAAQASKTTAPATKPAAPAAQKPAAPAPAAQKPAAAIDESANIPDSATVITLTGFCAPGATAPCTRSITKGEFDKVAKAINPNLAPDARRRLAGYYVQLLALSNEAKKEGLDKEANFDEKVRLATMQLMAGAKSDKLAEGTAATQAEIDNFYNENPDLFQQLSIRRVIVPKQAEKNAVPAEELKKLADAIQQRCSAGEDTDKLQADVWVKAVMGGTPVNTNFGWRSRGDLQQQQLAPEITQTLLSLKSGDVSKVLEDANYYYIFKIDGKRLIQLKDASEEIAKVIQQQHYNDKMNKMLTGLKADLDEKFFGKAPEAAGNPAAAAAPVKK